VDAVFWVGCDSGEHAGPVPYCTPHARYVLGQASFIVCGQCQKLGLTGWIKILKVETRDGTEIGPPGDVQRALDVLFSQEGDDNDETT
jgi:hypothetical protein